MRYPGYTQENKRHGLSYSAKKVQKLAHDVIDQLDIAINALRDIKENGMGVAKATEALNKIEAIDKHEFGLDSPPIRSPIDPRPEL